MEAKTGFIVAFVIIVVHFFADFVFQSDWQAKNKSKRWDALLNHTLIYSSATVLVWIYWLNGFDLLWLFLITFSAHTVQDYFTSRLNSYLWNKGQVHWFFVSIGFDQVLHYAQLFLTYWLLTK